MSTAINNGIDWVRIERYCELTGETTQSVKTKRNNGMWLQGVQYEKKPDGVIWYNLTEIHKWLAKPSHK